MEPETIRDGMVNEGGFAGRISQKREHQKENVVDRGILISQAQSLLDSVDKAIAQLMSSSSPAAAKHMTQFQAIQQNAQSVLSALTGGKGESVSALGRLESTLSSDLHFIEDSDSQKDGDDAKKPDAASASKPIHEAAVIANPLFGKLTHHVEQADALLADNHALRAQAHEDVAIGKADLVTTLAVAAMLYEGNRNREDVTQVQAKVADFLEGKKNEMRLGTGAGASEEAVVVRTDRILRQAQFINEGMLADKNEGTKRVIAVADAFIGDPMRGNMQNAEEHFAKASAHLEKQVHHHNGKHAKQHRAHFTDQVDAWKDLQQKTLEQHAAILTRAHMLLAQDSAAGATLAGDESGEALYSGLMKKLHLGDMMKNAEHYAHDNHTLLHKQAAVYHGIHDETLAAQAQLAAVLTGQSSDMRVAEELGMKQRDLRHAALKFQVDNDRDVNGEQFRGYTRDAIDTIKAGQRIERA